MQDRELYARILGITDPWRVERVELKLEISIPEICSSFGSWVGLTRFRIRITVFMKRLLPCVE
ncbi:MAG: hypothetical protein HZA60_10925 [Deltaproteobacteria bacterium]|nr:hypothetical protein [Deltaproteobacteria bacterium]